jgi:hypothetical protein
MAYTVSAEDFFLDLELSFAQGDSSIYDTNTLRNSEAFNLYGFGAIIRLYALPDVFNSGNIKPTVESTEIMSSLAISYAFDKKLISASSYVIKDKNLWVVLPSVVTSDKKVSKQITEQEAIKKYKLDSKHLGKFALENNAREYKKYVDSYFEASLKASSGSVDTRKFGQYITSFEVSYSIEGANQIQFTLIDKDYKMMEQNFFMNRRQIMYRGEMYEIGVVEVGQGPAGSPQVTVTAWNAAVQKMKRDKKPENLTGSSAYEYAFNAAKKYGLKFVAEKNGRTQTINKGNGSNKDDSVWSVLQAAANADEFVLFVTDGTMVYGSQKWLMWKFGTDSKSTTNAKTKVTTTKKYSRLYFDPAGKLPADAEKFQVVQYPSIRQSENDPLEGDGSIQVFKPNGCIIRPGQTVIIGPKPSMFQGGYLVTEVSFSEGTNDPVQISFRTPEKPSSQTDKP